MAVPDPANNGQFLYSKGLVEAAAAAAIDLDIIAHERAEGCHEPTQPAGSHWWIAHDRQRTRWESAASVMPHLANRANTPAMRRLLAERLRCRGHWDAIVFDSLAGAWGLRQVLAHVATSPRRPRLIYVAHNHETSLARRIVEIHPHPLKRQVNRVDAVKVRRLEWLVSRHADLITANSPEDCALFSADFPGKPVECLHPVFLGTPLAARHIDRHVPRRAVIIGSYDWLPKRVNLIEFLRVADPLFAAAGVELLVVGGADPRFLESLSRTTRATRFTGPVADARAHLADARIGIAAERVGGGFKMKTLDYVFHRVPLAALAGTIPGLPVRDGKSALICPDASLLARRIIGVIDDFDTLNRMQRLAYKASAGVFAVANAARVLRRAAAGPDPADQEVPILAPAAAL